MLTQEDQQILGLHTRQRRASAVSQALRAIRDDIDSGVHKWHISGLDCQILVAADRETRERAYALAHRIYRRSGYVPEDGQRLCVSPHDASQHTLTLLAQDAQGNDCATISLVFDSQHHGLPCDEIYRNEVDALRASGCRLAEVTRLAIDDSCSGAKVLLLHLFNQCYIFARIVRNQTDLLVEVNPRHVKYYQRLLRFQQAGPERPCSRVQGAPALLLRLNFDQIEETVIHSGCTQGRDLQGERLHPYPYTKPEESAIARFLAQQHRPMSAEDACYFQLMKQSSDRTASCAAGE
jgi:hypothetical protein